MRTTPTWVVAIAVLAAVLGFGGCGGGESDPCAGVTCSGHGTCAVAGGEPACLCAAGYRADGLECLADPCAELACVFGTCRELAGAATCECGPGVTGAACDACATGYHPEGLRCLPDSPCDTQPCVRGICRVEGGSAVCDCDLGYAGAACDGCAAGYHPVGLECEGDQVCDPDPCAFGLCHDVGGEPVCDCDPGYAGERCDSCAAGYEPVGLSCQPLEPDPCDPNPCTEPGRTVCRPVDQGYTCACDPGTHEEDGTCVADTVCDPATTCSGHGSCTGVGLACDCDDGYSGAFCQECAAGYHREGGLCLVDSPCEPNPCSDSAGHRTVCQVVGSGYACLCDAGYRDENGTCVPDSPCLPNPCTSAGRTVCVVVGSGFRCDCDPGTQDRDGDGVCRPTCQTAGLQCPPDHVCSDASGEATCVPGTKPPIYIAFHWHMHQPIYWPYESIAATEAAGRMGYSVYQIHFDRTGPYTSWPRDAIAAGLSLSHLGAQVSISGSLMENLGNLEAAGAGFGGWTAPWIEAMGWRTALGNPRLDLVQFGYHHPLMGLVAAADIRLQLQAHREKAERVFGPRSARGIFPPECAFSERMIPALVAEGIEWVLVDNIHFDRSHVGYTFRPESNLPPPNRADVVNQAATDWVQLTDLWAPSPVSAPWGYQPHWVQYIDPVSGAASRIVAVPAARYEGNEDARGGFGALQYETVLSQYEAQNTDPRHPMLVVLHHDGDNYGGGTESYYHGNFGSFVAWVQSQPDRFVATTVQDYLDQFPPDEADVIHVEDGSWSGADNGDPEFAKWNGDPNASGYSPDRNSWAVLTAVQNRVHTAEAISPHSSIAAVVDGAGNETDRAWHWLLNAETSCYWYWDFSQGGLWDSHPTRAANQAAAWADIVLAGGADPLPPTIYLPQREPYNPGLGTQPSDFTVWTLVYDVSGLSAVTLHWRLDEDGVRDEANDLLSGGSWQSATMSPSTVPPQTDPLPTYQAALYQAEITGLRGVLVDYTVSATDGRGLTARSPLLHVWVDTGGGGTTGCGDLWTPASPGTADPVLISWGRAGALHWGVDAGQHGGVWSAPPAEYWPAGSVLWSDGKAIETPLVGPDAEGCYHLTLGPFSGTAVQEVNFVFHHADGTWSSPDQRIPIGAR